MKKLFPMLGEIEILNTQELAISTKFGLPGGPGYQEASWRLLYGSEMPRDGYTLHPMSLRRDSLNHALWFYLKYFLEIFTSQEGSLYLVSQDLRRLRSKIVRYLDRSNGAEAAHAVLCDPPSSNIELFSQVLNFLDEEICRFNADAIPMASTEPPAVLEPANPGVHDDELLDLRELACLDGAIKSIIVNSFNKMFVVLETGLDAPTLKTCMETMIRVFPNSSQMPMIVTASMFEYILRHYEPFGYVPLMRRRRVLFGEDLSSNIPAPSHDAFVHYLFGRVPNLLTFPRSYTVILGYAPTVFSIRELECTVEQFLLLKLYLEKRVVQPCYDKLLIQCESHYPEHFVKLRALKETRHANSSQEWFGFLRGLANDVRRCLTKLPDSVDCAYGHESHVIARGRMAR